MAHSDLVAGFVLVIIGQGMQIAYHHYHDKKQNELLTEIRDNTLKG